MTEVPTAGKELTNSVTGSSFMERKFSWDSNGLPQLPQLVAAGC